jgi:hypothetical protein
MKQIFLLVFFLFIFSTSFSQDIIYLMNGQKVAATILGVSKEKIRYHMTDDPDGLIREIASREVYMITYRNEKEEIFGIHLPQRSEKYFSNGKNEYNSLSLGFGESHGFLGSGFSIDGADYKAGGIMLESAFRHSGLLNILPP